MQPYASELQGLIHIDRTLIQNIKENGFIVISTSSSDIDILISNGRYSTPAVGITIQSTYNIMVTAALQISLCAVSGFVHIS